tara:strand:+ start:626 stop:1021 length:396 start_codon:yes stop_codon:yes gene_type:complete
MPSTRKRIGYLPSVNTQEKITMIANKENLSQSKVVGILVEEALIARGSLDIQNPKNSIGKSLYNKEKYINNLYLNNNDLDELISDKGITYNKKNYNNKSDNHLSILKEKDNEELYKLFKQFILFQKTIVNK